MKRRKKRLLSLKQYVMNKNKIRQTETEYILKKIPGIDPDLAKSFPKLFINTITNTGDLNSIHGVKFNGKTIDKKILFKLLRIVKMPSRIYYKFNEDINYIFDKFEDYNPIISDDLKRSQYASYIYHTEETKFMTILSKKLTEKGIGSYHLHDAIIVEATREDIIDLGTINLIIMESKMLMNNNYLEVSHNFIEGNIIEDRSVENIKRGKKGSKFLNYIYNTSLVDKINIISSNINGIIKKNIKFIDRIPIE